MSEPAAPDWYRGFFSGAWLEVQAAVKGDSELTRRETDWLVERLGLEEGSRVLDVPCGTGRHAVELAGRGREVVGVDLSTEVLAAARERARSAGATVTWLEADMRELPADGSFDAAYCWWGSFGYLDEEGNAAFLRAVAQSLRSGGRFALDAVTLESFCHRHRPTGLAAMDDVLFGEVGHFDARTCRNETEWHFVAGGRHETRRGSIRIYSCRELLGLLEGAGFGAVEFHGDLDGGEWTMGDRARVLATRD